MSSKRAKIYFFFLLSILLLSSTGITTADASSVVFQPTLSSLNPKQSPAGQQITLLGLSYRDGSEIVFYQGPLVQARVALTPMETAVVNTSSPLLPDPSSTEFTFTVPPLVPDFYTVRLEHAAKFGISDPIPFAIQPVVNSISPLAGNHLTKVEIGGTGFEKDATQNMVRFLPNYQLVPDISSESNLQLTAASLPHLPVGSYDIQVFIKSGDDFIESSYSPGLKRNFILYPHNNMITPNNGITESNFAIGGIYYGSELSKIKINFYQGSKKQAEAQPGQILFGGSLLLVRVPSILAEGQYIVKVSVQDAANPARWIESDNSINFTVTTPPPPPHESVSVDPTENKEVPGSPDDTDP